MNAGPLWTYIEERERIRLRKEGGTPWPWTEDPILQAYSFTNVRRIHDRTTQAFLAIYRDHAKVPAHVALYNCGVYRLFGTEDFAAAVGWQNSHDLDALQRAVEKCQQAGGKAYTGAYMVRADNRLPKVVSNAGYLAGLWGTAPDIVAAIQRTRTWEAGYRVLRTVRGFGPTGTGFMAKEVLQDYLLWLPWTVKDAATFTPIGPGARRGLNRLAGRLVEQLNLRESLHLGEIRDLLEQVQPRWTKAYPKAGPLTAHDIQFCLCEMEKYLRTANGEGTPRSRYRHQGGTVSAPPEGRAHRPKKARKPKVVVGPGVHYPALERRSTGGKLHVLRVGTLCTASAPKSTPESEDPFDVTCAGCRSRIPPGMFHSWYRPATQSWRVQGDGARRREEWRASLTGFAAQAMRNR